MVHFIEEAYVTFCFLDLLIIIIMNYDKAVLTQNFSFCLTIDVSKISSL